VAGAAALAAGTLDAQAASSVGIVVPERAPGPARWAGEELAATLRARQVPVKTYAALAAVPTRDFPIVLGLLSGAPAESFSIEHTRRLGRPMLDVAGADARGQVYAALELADRVRYAGRPMDALATIKPTRERPVNQVRAVSRLFTSSIEDLPWFHDREMWPAYFTMLATERFNRMQLALGIGYDFLREVTDAYFLFPYPFLLAPPGYNVRATNVTPEERERNLESLKFIAAQAAARGLEFQLGLWMHGYQWTNSPNASHVIEGLTPENHGAYCRDALTMLLRACPGITGVTFRIHGESGVAEGSYDFWKSVFDGVVRSGRKIEIDLHNKGLDEKLIDIAVTTGMPVKVSPKYWAEHLGLPYHQAAIREQEMPKAPSGSGGLSGQFFALSGGSRNFTRYGYADLFRAGRKYGVIHRIWSGTQRLLLWGDPASAAAYSRAASFCGSAGMDIMEPLSFKGRRGSGLAGGRCAYADKSLEPRWDWQKYLYTYRVWGRSLYNPQAEAGAIERPLRTWFADAAEEMGTALAAASRILPTITTAHMPSAANNNYWPEMYTNQPIVDTRRKHQYTDMPQPHVFGNVSPLDPQLFMSVNECATALLKKEVSGKYTPLEVAQWLEELATGATQSLKEAEEKSAGSASVDFKRWSADIKLQCGIGRFFAAKLRAGVIYAFHENTVSRPALNFALSEYMRGIEIWREMAEAAQSIYRTDVTVGEHPWLRGHWIDRVRGMTDDFGDMEGRRKLDGISAEQFPLVAYDARPPIRARHQAATGFRYGTPVELAIAVERATAIDLYYRQVNQAERWVKIAMKADGADYRATIPAEYTKSPFPLEYYFEIRIGQRAVLYPGLGVNRMGQPYIVVQRTA
jgi:hypothetical protein